MDREELLERYARGERNFAGVDLHGVDLSGAVLRNINFDRADLSEVNFSGADLDEAYGDGISFDCCYLLDTNLGMDLNIASYDGAMIEGTILENEDLYFGWT